MNKYERMTKAELIQRLQILEKNAPATLDTSEHERRLRELQAHQAELETQIRTLREAQLGLEGSRDRYADFFDFAPVGYVTLDAEGSILELNLTAAQMFDRERMRMVGRPFRLHVVREDQAALRHNLDTLANAEAPGTVELRLRRPGAEPMPVMMQSVRIYDFGRKTHLFRVALSDLTVRKQTEAALREMEQRYRALFELSPDAILINQGNRISAINPAGLSLFGATDPAQVLGRPPYDFFHQDYHQLVHERIKTLLSGRGPVPLVENRIVRMDGEVRAVEVIGTTIPQEGGTAIQVILRDISEQKKAEAALHLSERSLRMLSRAMEQSPVSVLITEPSGTINYVNPKFTEVTGYSAAEVLGKNPRLLKSGQQPPEFYQELWATITAGRDWRGEFSNRKKSGELFWESAIIAPIHDERHRITHFVALKLDITDRKKAEAALRETEAQLGAVDRRMAEIMRGMTEACFALDREWRFTFVNDRCESLFPHRRDEMLGRPIWEVFHKLVGTPMEKNCRRAMAERVPVSFEAFSPIAERWLDIRLFPSGEGLAAFILDIQERKIAAQALRESEERFRRLVEQTPDGIFVADRSGRYTDVNTAGAGMLGYTREEILQRGIADVITPEEVARMASKLAKYTQGAVSRVEWRFRRKDGSEFDGEVVGRALPDGGYQGILRDTTARNQAKEFLRQRNEELRALLDTLPAYVWVAHDKEVPCDHG